MNRSQYLLTVCCILLAGATGSVWVFTQGLERKSITPNSGVEIARTVGCRSCHEASQPAHDLHAVFDCNACHLGDVEGTTAEAAHTGMIRIPGNLQDAARTCAVCHAQEVSDVHHSLMATNAGIVAVDRYVFGEQETPDGTTPIDAIGHSAADSHLRNLCASCHLGNEKFEFGPIDDASRGGGCNACHLNYHDEALAQLDIYLKNPEELPSTHPTLDLNITDQHCLGCHSRSGRISMNYQGYHETAFLQIPDGQPVSQYKQLQDGRVFEYVAEDVHHQAGLSCVDCHTYADVMGDGETHFHEEHAVKVRCEDCHNSQFADAETITSKSLPEIYQKIYKSRGYAHATMLKIRDGGIPLVNSYLPGDGRAFLFGKQDRVLHELIPPAEVCNRDAAHRNLSCSACHTQWAPQCIECHTEYNPTMEAYDLLENHDRIGGWMETAGEMRADAPALGIYEQNGEPSIQPAIPGMVMTLDTSRYQTAEAGSNVKTEEHHRLFAPASPHTTSKAGRDCRSCHLNPVALGYGRGSLEWNPADETGKEWVFRPDGPLLDHDSLPADAWIPFLGERDGPVSTRLEFRPFNVPEQKRILRVGACLTCHEGHDSTLNEMLVVDFEELLDRLPKQCGFPRKSR